MRCQAANIDFGAKRLYNLPMAKGERNEWLVKWRETRKLSQPMLAAMLGVSSITLSRWERGAQIIPPYLKLALKGLDQSLNPPADKSKPKKKK